MATIFTGYDSISRPLQNCKETDTIFNQITETTTPEKFEKLREPFPGFELGHCKSNHHTLLHEAVFCNNLKLIEYFVKKAPFLLERGRILKPFALQTPLQYALFCQNIKAAQLLIELDANIDVITDNGETILGSVARLNLKQWLHLLIQYNAKLNPQMEYSDPLYKGDKETQAIINHNITQATQKLAKEIFETINNTYVLPCDLGRMVCAYCYS